MLSRTSSYALSAVLRIAAEDGSSALSAAGLAEALDVPGNYIGKILNRLVHEGILESQRGRGGGFSLARPASEVSLADVIGPFEELGVRRCLLGRPECRDAEACALHQKWKKICGPVDQFLAGTTLDQVPSSISD